MNIFASIVMACSLCADCFAVSLCSGVTLKTVSRSEVFKVAAAFAVIQTALLVIGWLLGSALLGLVIKVSHVVGFLLLLYVGGSMLLEGIRNEGEVRNLNGWRNIFLGGVATSIDALAVGVARSMQNGSWGSFAPLVIAVFVVTAVSVVAGIWGGRTIGRHFGRWAEIAGGIVLVTIGFTILFDKVS